MKAELEAKLVALKADVADKEDEIAATEEKLVSFYADIPPEFHGITAGIFDKLKQYF